MNMPAERTPDAITRVPDPPVAPITFGPGTGAWFTGRPPSSPRSCGLRLDERRDLADGRKIVGHQILVVHVDPELVFDRRDKGHHPERVDDVVIDQREVRRQLAPRSTPAQIVGDE